MRSLEQILRKEPGTKEQYDERYDTMPTGGLVRSVVGPNQTTANEAFSRFLTDTGPDSRRMCFVRQVVSYIVRNRSIKDLSVLQESPFADRGRVGQLFGVAEFASIRDAIERMNRNAMVVRAKTS